MKDFWNSRYSQVDFAYGTQPNIFFKREIDKLNVGKILLPADGEGRNSVYAAQQGWDAFACDISSEGEQKARKLAELHHVKIDYKVDDFGALTYRSDQFDVVALIFAHFPANKKQIFHRLADKYLKVGGTMIIEAFSKNHIKYNSVNPKVGGPKQKDILYSIEEIKRDFPNYDISILEEVEIDLNEGDYHIGLGSVIRFSGRKCS